MTITANDLHRRTKSLVVEAAKKLSPVTFIRAAVADMERSEVDALAAAYLLSQVKMNQRRATLTAERGAEREPVAKEPNWGTQAWEEWATKPENEERAQNTRERREMFARIDREHTTKLMTEMDSIIGKFKDTLHMEWTAELLDSEFATGDGSKVTWGDATRDQHADRFNMHKRNATAGMEGAARHQQAIETLDTTGATTLREAVSVAA